MRGPNSHWNGEEPSIDEKSKEQLARWMRERPSPDALRRIGEIVASCPYSGQGVHLWLYSAALRLHRLGLSPADIEMVLDYAVSNCGRSMKPDEIESAIRNSSPYLIKHTVRKPRTWPARNYDRIYQIAESGITASQLRDLSPVALPEELNQAEGVIDALFPGNPLLCVASSKYRSHTKPREEWRGLLPGREFIVPSPMASQFGTTQDGKRSERCLDNVGPRAFLVVEFDFDEKHPDSEGEPRALLKWAKELGKDVFDIGASLHRHLANLRPLCLVVNSSGKSLHGWYPTVNSTEEELYAFMFYAVALGADALTWTPSQLVRMPDGRRSTGERQPVIYFAPAKIAGGKV